MNDLKDKKRLVDAAKNLRDELREQNLHKSIRFENVVKPIPDRHHGWYINIASWSDRPAIALWLDTFSRHKVRDFGITFWSTKLKKVTLLIDELPSNLRPRKEFEYRSEYKISHRKPYPKNVNKLPMLESFPRKREYYFGMYDFGNRLNIQQAVGFISAVVNSVTPNEELANDIEALGDLNTSRKTLIDARCGQGKYRDALIDYWGGCVVTGCKTEEALRASHIKAWSKCKKTQKLDPKNGLLLVGTLDALFDRGRISFSDNGRMLISESIMRADRTLLNLGGRINKLKLLSPAHRKYLKFHRRHWGFSL
jgi:HNH endonuclease